jgi:hypothetical protein
MLLKYGDTMKKNIILKYLLIYLPFISGLILYSFGIYNIFSSLLVFLGGYISIKNTFDYRKLNKNINNLKVENNLKKENYQNTNKENIIYTRKIKKVPRIRKRTKN